MAIYGVSLVDPASDWNSASVSAIIYTISYYVGPCYNSTPLYLQIVKGIGAILSTGDVKCTKS